MEKEKVNERIAWIKKEISLLSDITDLSDPAILSGAGQSFAEGKLYRLHDEQKFLKSLLKGVGHDQEIDHKQNYDRCYRSVRHGRE